MISGDKQVSCSLIPTLPRSERDGHGGMGNDGSDKQQGSRQRNRGGLSCKVVIFGKGAGESSEQPLGMALRSIAFTRMPLVSRQIQSPLTASLF